MTPRVRSYNTRNFRPSIQELDKLQLLDASQMIASPFGMAVGEVGSPQAILDSLPTASGPQLDSFIKSALDGNAFSSPVASHAPPPLSSIESAISSSVGSLAPSSSNLDNPKALPFAPQLTAAGAISSPVNDDALDSTMLKSRTAASPAAPGAIRPMRISSGFNSNNPTVSTVGHVIVSAALDGSGSGSGSASNSMQPYSFSDTLNDGTGDTVSVNISFNPNPNGTFIFDFTLTESYGSGANSGTGSLTLDFNVGASSATFVDDVTASDSYSIDDIIAAPNLDGTWTDSGKDYDQENDTITLNFGGTSTETYTQNYNTSETFALTASGTNADGTGFTYSDTGNNSSTGNDDASEAGSAPVSDNHTDEETSTETTTAGQTGNGITASSTSTETATWKDTNAPTAGATGSPVDTTTTTDIGTDTSSFKDTGTINGASFTVTDNQSDAYNDSDTATTGGASGPSDDQIQSGSNHDKFSLSLTNVNDGSGSGSGSSSSSGSGSANSSSDNITINSSSDGTYDDTADTEAGNPSITNLDDKNTSDSSNSESGTYMGKGFSESASGNSSSEITGTIGPNGYTQTGDTVYNSPPNGVSTGILPSGGAMSGDIASLSETASNGPMAAASAAVATLTTTLVSYAPNPDDPINQLFVPGTQHFTAEAIAQMTNAELTDAINDANILMQGDTAIANALATLGQSLAAAKGTTVSFSAGFVSITGPINGPRQALAQAAITPVRNNIKH